MWLYGYEKELRTKTKARSQIGNSVEAASKIYLIIMIMHALADLMVYINIVNMNVEGYIE